MKPVLIIQVIETTPGTNVLSFGHIPDLTKATDALYSGIMEGIKRKDPTGMPLLSVIASVVELVKAVRPDIAAQIRHQVIDQIKKEK